APNPEGKKYAGGGQFYINGPKIHDYLQEMHQEVMAKHDILTVGEMPGASVEDAKLYTDPNRKELNMVFTFEHMDLDSGPGGKWNFKPLRLRDLKENITQWLTGLYGVGWN